MKHTVTKTEGTLVVTIEGEMDLFNSYKMRDEIAQEITGHIRNVVLDLSVLSYIDSSGIGVLLGFKETLEKNGKNYSIKNIPPAIMQLFEKISVDLILKDNIVE